MTAALFVVISLLQVEFLKLREATQVGRPGNFFCWGVLSINGFRYQIKVVNESEVM